MSLVQELHRRRVPYIAGGYITAGMCVQQILIHFEERMVLSPHLVDLVLLCLVLLLPSVMLLAWVYGAPGKDHPGLMPKIVVPANLVACALLLGFLFHDRELGAVTETVKVEDEHGVVSERLVPKSEFRHRVYLFYPENTGLPDDDWTREAITFLLSIDMSQDIFVSTWMPTSLVASLQEVGSDDGHGLTRALQRKIARDHHIPHFLTGTISRRGDVWTFTTQLNESESGKASADRSFEAADLYTLADLASRQLREDLGIPSSHIEESKDLPVADLMSADLEAVQSYVKGQLTVSHHNDWAGAVPMFEDAVARDPRFALAQFGLYRVYHNLGRTQEATAAITAAVENLHQLPERRGFAIKTTYFYSEKQDPDMALAVLKHWNTVYPTDIGALNRLATYTYLRQDLPGAIAAYEKILEIDPSRVQYLAQIANMYFQLGDYDESERYFRRYAELFPNRSEGHMNLSQFYSATGDFERARTSLEHAQMLDPEELDLALTLVILNLKTGRYDESRRIIESRLSNAKTPVDRTKILANKLVLTVLIGQTDILIETLDLLYAAMSEIMAPNVRDVQFTMSLMVLWERGRPQEFLRRVEEFSSLLAPPDNKMVSFCKGIALAELGRIEDARKALAETVEYVDTFKVELLRPLLVYTDGYIAEAAGDLDSAVAGYRSLVESQMFQKEAGGWFMLARALRKLDRHDEALEAIAVVFDLWPEYPLGHLEMARILNAQGDTDRAREHLQKAQNAWADADADFPPAVVARELAAVFP